MPRPRKIKPPSVFDETPLPASPKPTRAVEAALLQPDAKRPIKRGVLNKDELHFVEIWHRKKSVEEIANDLNRSEEMIQKTIDHFWDENPNSPIVRDLRNTTFYRTIREEMSVDELALFEAEYINLSKEFSLNELNAFEKKQLMDYIRAEIREHRFNRDLRYLIDEQIFYQKEVERLRSLLQDKPKDADIKEELSLARTELENIARRVTSTDKTIRDTETLKRNLFDDLKATRKQRLDKLVDNKRNFTSLLKDLMEEDFRERSNLHLHMTNTAAVKVEKQFARPTKFKDGTIEQPLLSVETLDREATDGQG